jgi:hypothetical protein
MTTAANTTNKNSILAAVHETASDLHRLGHLDNSKMEKFNTLCSVSASTRMTIGHDDFVTAIKRIKPQQNLVSWQAQ